MKKNYFLTSLSYILIFALFLFGLISCQNTSTQHTTLTMKDEHNNLLSSIFPNKELFTPSPGIAILRIRIEKTNFVQETLADNLHNNLPDHITYVEHKELAEQVFRVQFNGTRQYLGFGTEVPIQTEVNNTITTILTPVGLQMSTTFQPIKLTNNNETYGWLELQLTDEYILNQIDLPVRVSPLPLRKFSNCSGTWIITNAKDKDKDEDKYKKLYSWLQYNGLAKTKTGYEKLKTTQWEVFLSANWEKDGLENIKEITNDIKKIDLGISYIESGSEPLYEDHEYNFYISQNLEPDSFNNTSQSQFPSKEIPKSAIEQISNSTPQQILKKPPFLDIWIARHGIGINRETVVNNTSTNAYDNSSIGFSIRWDKDINFLLRLFYQRLTNYRDNEQQQSATSPIDDVHGEIFLSGSKPVISPQTIFTLSDTAKGRIVSAILQNFQKQDFTPKGN